MSPPLRQDRRAEIAANLAVVRERIATAARSAGRDPADVTLIAITKTFPAADAATLLELGVTDLGENRDQDARPKAAEVPQARWHFVGQLQTNKARSVATYADVVQTVDRPSLVTALAKAVGRAERGPLDVLIQVSLDGDPQRGGAVAADVPGLAEAVAGTDELALRGVMAVAPAAADPVAAFAALAAVATDLRAAHPGATWVSAGMSQDLEPAVEHGATHVRVGSALLGRRTPLVG